MCISFKFVAAKVVLFVEITKYFLINLQISCIFCNFAANCSLTSWLNNVQTKNKRIPIESSYSAPLRISRWSTSVTGHIASALHLRRLADKSGAKVQQTNGPCKFFGKKCDFLAKMWYIDLTNYRNNLKVFQIGCNFVAVLLVVYILQIVHWNSDKTTTYNESMGKFCCVLHTKVSLKSW